MTTADERLSQIEGRVAEHDQMLSSMRDTIAHLEHRMELGFEQVNARFIALEEKLDRRFDALDQKVDRKIEALEQKLDQRIDALEGRVSGRIAGLDEKIGALDGKLGAEIGGFRRDMAVQFRWTLGLVFTGFVAIVAALLART